MFKCYETCQIMTKADWYTFYSSTNEIDKNEYSDFITWWMDMRKSGVIEEVSE